MNETEGVRGIEELDDLGIRIAFSVYSSSRTITSIADYLDVPGIKVKIKINKLMQLALLKEENTLLSNGMYETRYSLANPQASLVDHPNEFGPARKMATYEMFSGHLKSLIMNCQPNRPFKTSLNYLRLRSDHVRQFILDIEEIQKKYELLEDDSNSDGTYGFMYVLAANKSLGNADIAISQTEREEP